MKNFKSYLGAILGAIVGVLPWILVYTYGNLMVLYLAFLVPFASFYGFKLLGGKTNRGTFIVISIITLIVMSIVALVVLPLIQVYLEIGKEYATLEYLQKFYEVKEFSDLVLKDYMYTTVFTIIGLFIIRATIKGDIGSHHEKDLDTTNDVVEAKVDTVETTETEVETEETTEAVEETTEVETEETKETNID